MRALYLFLIEAREEELLDLGRLDALDGLVFGDQAFLHHVRRDLDRGRRRPLAERVCSM